MKKGINWDEVVEEIADAILDSLDYFCWSVSGDTALECYERHLDMDAFELAQLFLTEGSSSYKVRPRHISLLKKMPKKYYRKLNLKVQKAIEQAIKELEKAEW